MPSSNLNAPPNNTAWSTSSLPAGVGGYSPLSSAVDTFKPWTPSNSPSGFSLEAPRLTPSPASNLGAPLTPAQETGKQVGDLVTRFLEETPALQDKIQHIDWNAISQEDLKPKVEKYRAVLQQALKHAHVPQMVDRKLIRLLDDPKNQHLATEFDAWLRKEPSPEVLASLHKAKPQRHASASGFEKPIPGEAFDDGEDFLADEPPQSLVGKIRAKAQDGYNTLKDLVLTRTGSLKPQNKTKPDLTTLADDDLGDTEWSP